MAYGPNDNVDIQALNFKVFAMKDFLRSIALYQMAGGKKNIDWMWTPFAESQRIHCGEFLLFAQFNATINHICRRPISILIDCRNIAWNGVSSQKTLLGWEIISRNHLQIFFFSFWFFYLLFLSQTLFISHAIRYQTKAANLTVNGLTLIDKTW